MSVVRANGQTQTLRLEVYDAQDIIHVQGAAQHTPNLHHANMEHGLMESLVQAMKRRDRFRFPLRLYQQGHLQLLEELHILSLVLKKHHRRMKPMKV